jgi:lysophospholipase L1-like esterase
MIINLRFIALFGWFTIITMNSYSSEIIDPRAGKLGADSNIVWYDATLLGIEGKGWLNTESDYDRLPLTAKEIVREPVWELSHCSAGISVRFATNAETLNVRWTLTNKDLDMPHMPATGVSGIDLYAMDITGNLMFCANGRPTDVSNAALFTLPASNQYVLYLPLYNGVNELEIGIPREMRLSKFEESDLKDAIVFYGTSITQGGCASRPGMAATSIVSRRLNTPVINLGFSGNGQMDIELAELLCEIDPAMYVLDCLWNMSSDLVMERVEPFIKRLRTIRPSTPIILVEDSSIRNVPTPKGDILRRIYAKLKAEGDENLYLLPNTGMLGEDWEGTVDGVHPNDLGMARQAAVFTKYLELILQKYKSNR